MGFYNGVKNIFSRGFEIGWGILEKIAFNEDSELKRLGHPVERGNGYIYVGTEVSKLDEPYN